MAKALEGKERERMLEEFAQVDAINRFEGFEPNEFMQQLRALLSKAHQVRELANPVRDPAV